MICLISALHPNAKPAFLTNKSERQNGHQFTTRSYWTTEQRDIHLCDDESWRGNSWREGGWISSFLNGSYVLWAVLIVIPPPPWQTASIYFPTLPCYIIFFIIALCSYLFPLSRRKYLPFLIMEDQPPNSLWLQPSHHRKQWRQVFPEGRRNDLGKGTFNPTLTRRSRVSESNHSDP